MGAVEKKIRAYSFLFFSSRAGRAGGLELAIYGWLSKKKPRTAHADAMAGSWALGQDPWWTASSSMTVHETSESIPASHSWFGRTTDTIKPDADYRYPRRTCVESQHERMAKRERIFNTARMEDRLVGNLTRQQRALTTCIGLRSTLERPIRQRHKEVGSCCSISVGLVPRMVRTDPNTNTDVAHVKEETNGRETCWMASERRRCAGLPYSDKGLNWVYAAVNLTIHANSHVKSGLSHGRWAVRWRENR